MSGGYILRENLKVALTIAIDTLQKREAAQGYPSDSCQLAGFKDVLRDLNAGKRVEIRE